jgi:GNAT superfamily N-acetyltransferase
MAEVDDAPPLDPPERLTDQHDLASFEAGSGDTGGQTAWLKQSALKNDQDGYARTFVACFPGTKRVGAFFGINIATVVRDSLPGKAKPHGTPKHIPAVLIARLAVHQDVQGRGLGKAIVIAALAQCNDVLEGVGFRFNIVDAATDKARTLYENFDFKALDAAEFPTRPFLPVNTAAELIV